MQTYSASEVWTRSDEVAVQVQGLCSYRVVINEEAEEAHILAPGLDRVIELDPEFYPLEEAEVCAIMLVAQLEGGKLI